LEAHFWPSPFLIRERSKANQDILNIFLGYFKNTVNIDKKSCQEKNGENSNRSVMGGGWTRMGSPPKPCQADLSREGNRQVVLNAISLGVSSL
jgi:hypothetical protein